MRRRGGGKRINGCLGQTELRHLPYPIRGGDRRRGREGGRERGREGGNEGGREGEGGKVGDREGRKLGRREGGRIGVWGCRLKDSGKEIGKRCRRQTDLIVRDRTWEDKGERESLTDPQSLEIREERL